MPRTITWLHISDLHSGKPYANWDKRRVIDTLKNDIEIMKERYELCPDLIFFTGDAAWGQIGSDPVERTLASQFSIAHDFFESIRKSFSPEVPQSNLFLVPGNHDVNRNSVGLDQIDWLDKNRDPHEIYELMEKSEYQWKRYMDRLVEYREFLNNKGYFHLLDDPGHLIYSTIREVCGCKIGIAGLNSSWSCCREYERSKLCMGGFWQTEQLLNKTKNFKESNIFIALLHHPTGWLSFNEDADFWNHLNQNFNFVLHGHEHRNWVEEIVGGFKRIAAGACYDRSDKDNKGYNFVRLNLDNGTGKVWLRKYESGGKGWISNIIPRKTDKFGVYNLKNLTYLKDLPVVSTLITTSITPTTKEPLDEEIEEIIRRSFNAESGSCQALLVLWNLISNQTGSHSVDHGKQHIKYVLINLRNFFSYYTKPDDLLTGEFRFKLFAAAMIHDIGLSDKVFEVDSDEFDETHSEHSNFSVIEGIVKPFIVSPTLDDPDIKDLLENSIDDIIKIASAHSKSIELDAFMGMNSKIAVYLLRLADFLDIRPDRLNDETKESLIKNSPAERDCGLEPKRRHLMRHLLLKAEIKAGNVNIILQERSSILLESFAILRIVYEYTKEMLNALNNCIPEHITRWHLEPIDEELFGKIWPISFGTQLFSQEFKKEMQNWNIRKGAMEIDMIGHSLFGRFVTDIEHINDEFKELLEKGNLKMRIIILDPHVENQQMQEVFGSQKNSKNISDNERSILPVYDNNYNLVTGKEGDIYKTLNEIESKWLERVKSGSSLKVRLTTRLIYGSIVRMGKRMIMMPYRKGGLGSESIALLFTEKSPLLKLYQEEFNMIWNDKKETRLYIYKHSDISSLLTNPVNPLLPKKVGNIKDPIPYEYERFFLKNYKNRIKLLFESINKDNCMSYNIPPIEVEIQPSEYCGLNCVHCIGKYLKRKYDKSELKNITKDCKLDSLFYEKDGYKVEKFRISGLLGEPLNDYSREIVENFIKQAKENKRQIVIFTNGLYLDNIQAQNILKEADSVHISLDAVDKETFSRIKGTDDSQYEKVISGVTNFCKSKGESQVVTIGFVVTQANANKVKEAIEFAKSVCADVIRFKPDIRGVNAISWGTWKDSETTIETAIKEYQENKYNLKIVLTDIQWHNYWIPAVGRCWSQYFYTTVGPNGYVYPCDHLTSNEEKIAFGDLRSKTFQEIWEDSIAQKKLGERSSECILCPPYNWHLNKFLEELFVLYKTYKWQTVSRWIDEALS